MTEPRIDVVDRGKCRVITISNPAKRNAFSGDMARRFDAALVGADRDPAIRGVVVTGEGTKAFSSGHDLGEVIEHPEKAGDPDDNAAFSRPVTMHTPVIAAVNGAAYAAGFILAMSCDIIVAGAGAAFAGPGARIGLVPVGGQLSRLLATLPYPVAFKLLATAEAMPADEAARHGLVSEVCEVDAVLPRALAVAESIAGVSPAVVQAIKAGLNTTLNEGIPAGMAAENRLAALLRERPDGEEGVRAFLERRAPAFPDADDLRLRPRD